MSSCKSSPMLPVVHDSESHNAVDVNSRHWSGKHDRGPADSSWSPLDYCKWKSVINSVLEKINWKSKTKKTSGKGKARLREKGKARLREKGKARLREKGKARLREKGKARLLEKGKALLQEKGKALGKSGQKTNILVPCKTGPPSVF
ncbi:hypothetical protein A6R68_03320, partial [Neotoma lepida]